MKHFCMAFTTSLQFDRFMHFESLPVCDLLGALPSLAQSEAVVKILHLQTNPKIIAIWKDAAQTYEKAHSWGGGVMYEQVGSDTCQDITAVKGTADAIQDALMKSVAQEVDKSQWIAIAMDQLLGPDTGRVFMMRARTLPRATRHRKKLLEQLKTHGSKTRRSDG
jgi:hypothetical protein